MIVVLDTSPLCYLILIGEADLPSSLFGSVIIPTSVRSELQAVRSPPIVRSWIGNPPPWLLVRDTPAFRPPVGSLLGPGERGVLALGSSLSADLVVLDEKAARAAAKALGLRVTGLLGLLKLADSEGLCDLTACVARLQRTNFHASAGLLASVLHRHDPK